MKSPFGCCFHSSAVDVVEPFVLPADLESEPDPEPSPAPDHSAVKTKNGKSPDVISPMLCRLVFH